MQPPGTKLFQKNSSDAFVGSYMSTSTWTNFIGVKVKDANDCGIHPRCSSTKPNFAVTDFTKEKSDSNVFARAPFSRSESRKKDSSFAVNADNPPSNESNTWNRPEKPCSARIVAIATVECPCQQPHSITSPTGSDAA